MSCCPRNFASLFDLKCWFPDWVLVRLLEVFWSLLFDVEQLPYTVRTAMAGAYNKLLHKASQLDRALFQCSWAKLYRLVDDFITPTKHNRLIIHNYELETYAEFVELAKRLRRYYDRAAFSEIWAEFVPDLDSAYGSDFVRAVRYLALFLPFEGGLIDAEVEQVAGLFAPDGLVCRMRKLSGDVDLAVLYVIGRLSKYYRVDLSKHVIFVLENILPCALKVPCPVKGIKKVAKLLPKEDGPLGKAVFETLGDDVVEQLAKLMAYYAVLAPNNSAPLGVFDFSLQSIQNLCHPSNYGSWVGAIDSFLYRFTGKVARIASRNADGTELPTSIVLNLWSLAERLLFSKGGVSSSSGSFTTCLTCKYLGHIAPKLIVPKIVNLVGECLCAESLNEPHRTAAAIGLLCLSMPSILNLEKVDVALAPVISYLPAIIQGIDGNDPMKSIFSMSVLGNFSDIARVKDVSMLAVDDGVISDALYEAKEASSHFGDISILFTERIIEFLRNSLEDRASPGFSADDYVLKLLISVARSFYPQLAYPMAKLCIEKWIDYLRTEVTVVTAEVVGDTLGSFYEAHGRLVGDAVIEVCSAKLVSAVANGAGKLRCTEQYNRSMHAALIVLSIFLQYTHQDGILYVDKIRALTETLLQHVEQRKLFQGVCKVAYSMLFSMIHPCVRQVTDAGHERADCDPFSKWGRYETCETLTPGQDYRWFQLDGVDQAWHLLDAQKLWCEAKLSGLLDVESAVNVLFCLNNQITSLQLIWSLFSSGDIVTNSVVNEALAAKASSRLNDIFQILVSFDATPGLLLQNVDVQRAFVEALGECINYRGHDPSILKKMIGALDALSVNHVRFPRDKSRPVRILLRQSMSYFKLRLSSRLLLGEHIVFENVDGALQRLSRLCVSHFKDVRKSAQRQLKAYFAPKEKAAHEYLIKHFESMLGLQSFTEEELEGMLLLVQDELMDMVADNFDLLKRFTLLLLRVAESESAKKIKDAYKHISSLVNLAMKAFVSNNLIQREQLTDLLAALVSVCARPEVNWTTQILALNAMHSTCTVDVVEESWIESMLSLCLNKNAQVREWAMEVFALMLNYWRKKQDPNVFLPESFRPIMYKQQCSQYKAQAATAELLLPLSVSTEVCENFLTWQMQEDAGDATVHFRASHVDFIVALLHCVQDYEKLQQTLKTRLLSGKVDAGKQRALAEWFCGWQRNAYTLGTFTMLTEALTAVTTEGLSCWEAALEKCFDRRDPRSFEGLFGGLLENVRLHINLGNGPSLACGLRLMSSCHRLFRGFADRLVKLDQTEIDALLMHDFVAVGTEVGKYCALLAVLGVEVSVQFPNQASLHFMPHCRAYLNYLAALSTLPALSGYWGIFSENIADLLPFLTIEDNSQLLEDVKRALMTLILVRSPSKAQFLRVVRVLIQFIPQSRFAVQTRKFAADLLRVFVQHNFFHLRDANLLVEPLLSCELTDVREGMLGILVTIFMMNTALRSESSRAVCRELEARAILATIKHEKLLKERHILVIKASAIILSAPYAVDSCTPALLTALSRYVSDRFPVGPVVKCTFSDFRRTHHDTWPRDRIMFTDLQLDAIGELLVAPSYYA